MIVVTNGKDKITFKKEQLQKRDYGYTLFSKHCFLDVELDFILEEDKFIKILKCFESAEGSHGDVLREYKNRKPDEDVIVLNNRDYTELARLVDNFNNDDVYRKEALIESYSELFAYQCYTNYVLEELEDSKLEYVFSSYVTDTSAYKKEIELYKKEIYERTSKKLKEKYKVDLSYVFLGGSKNE